MNINDIYKKIIKLPTILDIEDEILFINYLKEVEIDDIKTNFDNFIGIISHIQDSHQDNGIFEVCGDNIHIFEDYLKWINSIQTRLGIDLGRYVDGFDINMSKFEYEI